MSDANGTPRVYYRIRDWETRYENHRSREIQTLDWVKIPICIGSDEYKEIVMGHPNGLAHLGLFYAVVQIAARCRPRGALLRFDGAPHTIESLARSADVTAQTCGEGVDRLARIGFLECLTFTAHAFRDRAKVSTAPHSDREVVTTEPRSGVASRRARGQDRSREDNTPPGSPQGGTPPANGNVHRPPRRRPSRSEEVAAYLYKKHQRQQEEHSTHEPNRENPKPDSSRAVDRVG